MKDVDWFKGYFPIQAIDKDSLDEFIGSFFRVVLLENYKEQRDVPIENPEI